MNAKRADVAVSGGKTDARKALYDRMCAERRAFRESLLAMPPEDALRNARRHFIMDKIILFVGTHDLGDGRVRALLNMERPLESALDAAESLDAVNEETIRERLERCADGQADSERERRKAMREAPVYPHGAETAAFGGHWEEYCASRAANVACRNAIEEAVSARYDGYDGSRVSVEAVREVAEAFGFERTLRVLANSVQWREREFSGDNLSWALSIPISQDEAGCEHNRNADYVVRTHPDILDGFISVARREYERELSPPPERQEGDKAPPDASKGQSRKCAKGKKRPER